ncbi:transporter substrate-binding domain-containing protein [Vreelandella aquamarina]|uniref:transporter substrate-binding domain-containing protein n=1 Tax=Vreelandella aquamarina TaxID=77097 RepID=UPI00384B7B51
MQKRVFKPKLKRAIVFTVLLCLTIAWLAGCRYPNNVERDMETIEGGTLYIGVTENPPWIIQQGQQPQGLEADLLHAFAETLNASIEWYWGSENELLQALKHHQLDIVAGGLTSNTRISQLAATTRPFFTTQHALGFKADNAQTQRTSPPPLQQSDVALPRVNRIYQAVEELGANPVISAHPEHTQGWVAGPTWWLDAHGFTVTSHVLSADEHVMALPKGENALMLALQRHLHRYDNLETQLQRLEEGL